MNRYEKVDKKWQKLKYNAKPCPACKCEKIGLNDSHASRIKRFYLECENCHRCAKSYPTIRLAIHGWNKQEGTQDG